VLGGDPTRLRQVLLNLVGNAVKFTEAGEVVVSAAMVDGGDDVATVRFEVSDTGPGIAPRDRDRLFESFSQADASITRRHGGSGLGLAISRQLVRLMGGEMGVESELGTGATFWFTVQLKKPAPGAPTASVPASPEALHGLRVLVVDDTAVNRTILEESLRSWGMTPMSAPDAERALEMLKEATARGEPFELAILDHQMPGMSGLELAQAVLASDDVVTPRLVLLTSTGQWEDARAAREAGVQASLTKPVRQSALYSCLTEVMGLARPSGPETASTETASSAPGPPPTDVLVVDDNVTNQLVAVAMLENLGHRVDVAANGSEAVGAVARKRYGAVFMDCQMPEMDGFEATREIRRREGPGHHTPVIAMTAGAMRSDQESSRAAGMDDFLAKPLLPEDVEAAMSRWVGPAAAGGDGSSSRPGESSDAEAKGSAGEVIDASRWALLRRLGNGELFEKAVHSFLDEAHGHLGALREALAGGDLSGVRKAAHVLAGGSGNLGAGRVSEAASHVEQLATSSTLPSREAVDGLEVELRRAEEAIDRLMEEART
jgi:two-component system sensor histidine kinase/response regulator